MWMIQRPLTLNLNDNGIWSKMHQSLLNRGLPIYQTHPLSHLIFHKHWTVDSLIQFYDSENRVRDAKCCIQHYRATGKTPQDLIPKLCDLRTVSPGLPLYAKHLKTLSAVASFENITLQYRKELYLFLVTRWRERASPHDCWTLAIRIWFWCPVGSSWHRLPEDGDQRTLTSFSFMFLTSSVAWVHVYLCRRRQEEEEWVLFCFVDYKVANFPTPQTIGLSETEIVLRHSGFWATGL